MSSPAPDGDYTVAMRLDDEDFWRCFLCGWEIETDDGIIGYCKEGHLIKCANVSGFFAADESSETETVSSEGWDEYEEDGWIDDDQVEDPYKFLAQCIKDIDESSCDTMMLIQAFDEIESIEDAYKVLIEKINSIDVEESEDEESTDEDQDDESDNAETATEGGSAANDREEGGIEHSAREVEGATNGEDDEGEEDGEEGEETSSIWEDATSEEDDSTSEEEESQVAEEAAPSVTNRPTQSNEETIEKLKKTIDFLTRLCEGLSGESTSLAASGQVGAEEVRALQVTVAQPSSPDQQLLSEPVRGSTRPRYGMLFDTMEIEAVVKKRRELIQKHDEDPPYGDDGEEDYYWELFESGEDLVAAIEKARFARNVTKRHLNRGIW